MLSQEKTTHWAMKAPRILKITFYLRNPFNILSAEREGDPLRISGSKVAPKRLVPERNLNLHEWKMKSHQLMLYVKLPLVHEAYWNV